MNKKKLLLIIVISFVGVFFSARWLAQTLMSPPVAEATQADPAHLQLGDTFLDHLDAGRYDDALAMTTQQVQDALADDKLKAIWEGLPTQLGALTSRRPLRGEQVEGAPIVTSTLVFGMAALDARIMVDAEGKISGFRLVPAVMPQTPSEPLSSSAAFSESDFVVGSGRTTLPGTLSLPRGDGPFPATVLVHGSGPHDRDQSIGPNKPFRDLAHGLAERGIAVLRYEKRTKAYPNEFGTMDFTVDQETVDDAVDAVARLRGDTRIDPARVFVAGHSLGALMAPRIAQRATEVAGLILLAAPARPLQDIVVEQVSYLADGDGERTEEEQAEIDDVMAKAGAVTTLAASTPVSDTLLGLPARYWIDLRDYDPVAAAQTLTQPMLILQGGRDYQVTRDGDFARWESAFSDATRVRLIVHPTLNHLLIAGQGPSLPAEYVLEGRVDTALIDDIADFVHWVGP